jgi:hypothetical protein
MNWRIRVRQLLDLDDALDTDGLLRKYTQDNQLYKLDQRRRLVAIIERIEKLGEDTDLVEGDD